MSEFAHNQGEVPAGGGRRVVLAIETSCDDTSVAAVDDRGGILALETASQTESHQPYGGVVPELASRNHTVLLPGLVERVLAQPGCGVGDLAAVAATAGPGLASSLLVGNTMAKAMALGAGVPFVAVNHMEGHLLSPFVGRDVPFPFLGLVVSGGHTLLVEARGVGDYELVGRSLDDAAGEAFDKTGKMLGLPYPGGPEIEKCAKGGDPTAFAFPRAMLESGDGNFSFSGLKTSVRVLIQRLDPAAREQWLPDVCASFQEAVVEVLSAKTLEAARRRGLRDVAVSGGVACNGRLRETLRAEIEGRFGARLHLVEPRLATDNAAMIGHVAHWRLASGRVSSLEEDVDPNLPLEGIGRLRGGRAAGR